MLPQAANQVSPSEDEYSFEMRKMREKQRIDLSLRINDKESETKASEYDESPIKYTTDLILSIVFLQHNRFYKHFDSHN